jgi:hypothetical protein
MLPGDPICGLNLILLLPVSLLVALPLPSAIALAWAMPRMASTNTSALTPFAVVCDLQFTCWKLDS